jgi:hypothetical protein
MGAFSASVLAAFERATGHRIIDDFDLITGTSTEGSSLQGWPRVYRARRSSASMKSKVRPSFLRLRVSADG